jgi:hypothetical protein
MDIATLGLPEKLSCMQRLYETNDPSTASYHLVVSNEMFMSWQASTGVLAPRDWQLLQVHAGRGPDAGLH